MNIKKDFPIFDNNPGLVYLDSAATAQRPRVVIEAMKNFLEHDNANVQRGLYTLSERAMDKFNKAREKIAKFINAETKEIIFTKNATESINILSYTIHALIPNGKNEIVLTEMEHHSNLIPWQQFAKRHGFKLKFIKVKPDYTIDYEQAKKIINEKTAIVSIIHASNVLGTVNDIESLISLSKKHKAITIIDAAQSITHLNIDVKKLDCDFLVFSSHKLFGPTGIGILYGKNSLLEELPPFQFGGGMISKVTLNDSTWAPHPEKFEPGTQNVAEAIATATAIDYLNSQNHKILIKKQEELKKYTLEKLGKVKGITIYHPKKGKTIGIISFSLQGIHPHDIASILNEDKIAVRAGHHCAMPLMKSLGIDATTRVSLQIYNTFEDIDRLVESLNKINRIFGK